MRFDLGIEEGGVGEGGGPAGGFLTSLHILAVVKYNSMEKKMP